MVSKGPHSQKPGQPVPTISSGMGRSAFWQAARSPESTFWLPRARQPVPSQTLTQGWLSSQA